ISPSLDWRQREVAFEKEFPGHFRSTLIVVDAPTPELVSAASAVLAKKLADRPKLFHSVEDLIGSEFFARNGLLFQPTANLEVLTQGLGRAGPLISTVSGDPSLRGLTRMLSLALVGVQNGMAKLDDYARALSLASDTVEGALAGKPAHFSWQELLSGKHPGP